MRCWRDSVCTGGHPCVAGLSRGEEHVPFSQLHPAATERLTTMSRHTASAGVLSHQPNEAVITLLEFSASLSECFSAVDLQTLLG